MAQQLQALAPFQVSYATVLEHMTKDNQPALYMAGDHGEYAVLDQRGRVIASNVEKQQ